MAAKTSESWLVLANSNKLSHRPTPDGAWDVLDQFAQTLQKSDHAQDQVKLGLEAVRDGIEADAVFWYPGTAADRLTVVGANDLSSEWCAGLVQRLLNETPGIDSQLLRSHLQHGPTARGRITQSVAMVRASKSQSSWIVAVSFRPEHRFQLADARFMSLARRLLVIHRQNAQTIEKLKETLFGMVRCLTATIDAKDPFTWGHSERVARLAVRLGRQMRVPPTVLSDLYLAGLLHDIGKIGIPDEVLRKPGKLTAEECRHVEAHTILGDSMMSNIKQLSHLLPGVRNHHERFDGHGYPDHLAGEDIPLLARTLAVADACDAMMSDRPYRKAMTTGCIDAILRDGAGTQWDPGIIEHFMACRGELYAICKQRVSEPMRVPIVC